MIGSLIKIPLILVAMIGLHTGTTSPNPPPSSNEKAPSTRLEVVLKQRLGLLLLKTICWTIALCEVAAIFAARDPTLPISQQIISHLVFCGSADSIRPTYLFFLGAFLISLGGYIRFSCFRALGRLFTFEMSIRDEHELITDGPYSIVRHPSYTGAFLTLIGIICWHSSPGSWVIESGVLETKWGQSAALLFCAYVSTIMVGLLLRMSKEDEALQKVFGNEWDDWASSVPYSLIPWIY